VEALSCFVFDGAGIGFEAVNVLAQAGVLCCELFDLLREGFVFSAFLLPAGEAVAAVDYVPGEEQGEEDCSHRADAAAVAEVLGPPALREGRGRGFWGFGHILVSDRISSGFRFRAVSPEYLVVPDSIWHLWYPTLAAQYASRMGHPNLGYIV